MAETKKANGAAANHYYFGDFPEDIPRDDGRELFLMLKPILESREPSEDKVRKIADAIVQFCPPKTIVGTGEYDEEASIDQEYFLEVTWEAIVDIVHFIPADHELIDILANVVKNLVDREGTPIVLVGTYKENLWTDLPILFRTLVDAWCDPTDPKVIALDGIRPDDPQRWMSLNAFIARIVGNEADVSYIYFGSLALAIALEFTEFDPATRSASLWVVSEWIFQGADHLFAISLENHRGGKDGYRVVVGDLWTGTELLGEARWNFWKMRFGQVAEQVDEPIKGRLKLAEATMAKYTFS